MVRLKEIEHLRNKDLESVFQFLMVRLKAKSVISIKLASFNISIPYGAIKSVDALHCEIHFSNFNSLWCD